MANLDRTTWLALGMEHGWLEHSCVIHEGLSYTEEESTDLEGGFDGCVVRYVVIPAGILDGTTGAE